ncbi:MAG: LTA synthase family protein [Lachnospiraceae bacterium]|nr:LTA synthase family protein [Lachnospiraceae bacterium]
MTKASVFVCAVTAAAVLALSVGIFAGNWKVSSLVQRIASRVHLPVQVFLYIAGALLGAGAFLFVFCLLYFLFFDHGSTARSSEHPGRGTAVRTQVLILAVSLLQCLQLQMSATQEYARVFGVRWHMAVLAVVSVYAVNLLISCLVRSSGAALVITSVTTLLWSLIDYYAVLFHGSPLFFSEFANAATAANVLSKYRLTVSLQVLCIAALFLSEIITAIRLLREKTPRTPKKFSRGVFRIAFGLAVMGLVVVLYRTPAVKPRVAMGFSWRAGVEEYGYLSCIYEDLEKRMNPVTQPEGYAAEKVEALPDRARTGEALAVGKPDIILILNETFYDIGRYADVAPDRDFLSEFYGIEGAFYGHAVVPSIGGGTNNTEFELLTSNSMHLLPIDAPFNYLDFSSDRNSLASYLQRQGYATAGLHCEVPNNYSRDRVYPLIGFERVVLGAENFTASAYGERSWTDEANYQDMISVGESMGDGPRFCYLLTMQNHGDWNKNASGMDTVHTTSNLGDLTDDVNEYLTSVELSASAFRKLTDRCRESNRPTIVFMLGDHAPSFISGLQPKDGMSAEEQEIAARSVPYAVWANFDLNWPENTEEISVPDIGPLLKQAAGLPLSTYDAMILDLHNAAPVRLSNGLYETADGSIRRYEPGNTDRTTELLRDYFFAEYNLLKDKQRYQERLFVEKQEQH